MVRQELAKAQSNLRGGTTFWMNTLLLKCLANELFCIHEIFHGQPIDYHVWHALVDWCCLGIGNFNIMALTFEALLNSSRINALRNTAEQNIVRCCIIIIHSPRLFRTVGKIHGRFQPNDSDHARFINIDLAFFGRMLVDCLAPKTGILVYLILYNTIVIETGPFFGVVRPLTTYGGSKVGIAPRNKCVVNIRSQ
jgi:hypothetical protein